MDVLKLLIVEDDEAQLQTWKRQIARFEAKYDFSCMADYVDNKVDAEKYIRTRKYDAAIIDIRLQNPEGVKDATSDGNQVREMILGSEILLIAHITGEPNQVDVDDRYKEIVKTFTKGDHDDEDMPLHERILEWVTEKNEITSTMNAVKDNINSKMAELFYDSIWPRWASWSTESIGKNYISTSIARHMSSHLYSELLEHSEGRVHPEEWYFLPPTFKRFNTGDIIKLDDSYYVLVSPRCDLERLKKDDKLLFAEMCIADKWAEDKSKLEADIVKNKNNIEQSKDENQKIKFTKKIEDAKSRFRQAYYGHKNNAAMFHFLPEINQETDNMHGPFFVDFSNMLSIAFESEESEKMMSNKIASISSEFVPSLVQRLGAYISRIGSPDYSHIY